MRPETVQPRINQEKAPQAYFGGQERIPVTNSPEKVEIAGGSAPELEPKSEAIMDVTGTSVVSSLPALTVNNSSNVVNDTAIKTNPLVANDKDVIENEWVKAAKKIVLETRDDPHRQEEEVGKLQIDYVSKRYGEEIRRS
jgi:hypothetical protein